MSARVVFADEKLEKAFDKLKNSKAEDKELCKWLNRAFDDLANNAFCGILVPQKLIPKFYIKKHGISNLWKYDLPRAWRLLYSVGKDEVVILAIILDWMNHKNYERVFGYT
jgi:Txe/YoeB family toxin of Txe-Axe toxin-antitoxin module